MAFGTLQEANALCNERRQRNAFASGNQVTFKKITLTPYIVYPEIQTSSFINPGVTSTESSTIAGVNTAVTQVASITTRLYRGNDKAFLSGRASATASMSAKGTVPMSLTDLSMPYHSFLNTPGSKSETKRDSLCLPCFYK